MIGLGRIPSGQTEDRDRPKSFRGVVGDCEGGLSVGVLVLRRRAQSISDFFLLVCFCSDSKRKQIFIIHVIVLPTGQWVTCRGVRVPSKARSFYHLIDNKYTVKGDRQAETTAAKTLVHLSTIIRSLTHSLFFREPYHLCNVLNGLQLKATQELRANSEHLHQQFFSPSAIPSSMHAVRYESDSGIHVQCLEEFGTAP